MSNENANLAELEGMKQAFAPADLDTAQTGARIAVKEGDRVAVVLSMGTSTAATVQVTMKQHNAASGGTTKDLSVANNYYHKAGSATSFTKVTPSSPAALVDVSTQFAADGEIGRAHV